MFCRMAMALFTLTDRGIYEWLTKSDWLHSTLNLFILNDDIWQQQMFLSVHLSYRFTDNVAVLKVIINFNEEVEEKPLSTWQTDWALNNTPFRCKCQTLIELSKYRFIMIIMIPDVCPVTLLIYYNCTKYMN